MPSRRRSRERALQMVFQWDASGAPPEKVAADFFGGLTSDDLLPAEPDRFARELFEDVVRNVDAIDALLRKHAANWTMERMSAVNRNLLRLAAQELRAGKTAPAVIIDEAVEIGRRFSGEDSTSFLNGVLDAVRRDPGL